MNYTKVPRSLIYKDRASIEEFGINTPFSLNAELYSLMRQYIRFNLKRNYYQDIILTVFNESYYLMTMMLMDDNLFDNYLVYVTSIHRKSSYSNDIAKVIRNMVVALCYVYMERPAEDTPILQTVRYSLRLKAREFAFLSCQTSRYIHPSAKEFAPVKITEDLLDSINWKEQTENYKPEIIRDLVDYLGETKKEKRLLVKSIYNQLMSADMLSPIPYSADSVLLSKYRELGGSTRDFINIAQDKSKENLLVYSDASQFLYNQMTLKKKIQDLERENKLLEDSNRQLKEQLCCMQEKYEQQKARAVSQKEQERREEQLQMRIEEMSKIISTMQGKVGNKAIQLKYIVESIKNKAVFVGLKEAYELFETINSMLCEEPVWIENRHELQDFFRECKKNNNVAPIISGDYVVNKQVNHEVNGVASGATGININKE